MDLLTCKKKKKKGESLEDPLILWPYFGVPSSRGFGHFFFLLHIYTCVCVCVCSNRISFFFEFWNNTNLCVFPPADVLIGGSASRLFGRFFLFIFFIPTSELIHPLFSDCLWKKRNIKKILKGSAPSSTTTRWTGYSSCLPWLWLPSPRRHSDVSLPPSFLFVLSLKKKYDFQFLSQLVWLCVMWDFLAESQGTRKLRV